MDRPKRLIAEPIPYHPMTLGRIFDTLARGCGKDSVNISPEHKKAYRDAINFLELDSEDVVLDAGCGTGSMALKIARRSRQVIGFDISRVSVQIARNRARENGLNNARFFLGELENPDQVSGIPDQLKFDKILVFQSLHHLPSIYKENSLVKLFSMLKPGGRIVIGDLMAFDDPEKFRHYWVEIGYDGGLTDRIETAEFHAEFLNTIGCHVQIERIHALLGIVVGYKKEHQDGLFEN